MLRFFVSQRLYRSNPKQTGDLQYRTLRLGVIECYTLTREVALPT